MKRPLFAGALMLVGCRGLMPPQAGQRSGPESRFICGKVAVEGRKLPSGFAHLLRVPALARGVHGVSHESRGGLISPISVRLGNGSFCFADPIPGDYILTVMPLSLPTPLALSYGDLSQGATSHLFNLGEDLRARLYDSEGKPSIPFLQPEGPALKYSAPPSDEAQTLFELSFPTGTAPNLAADPILLVAVVDAEPSPLARLLWVRGPALNGRITALMPIPGGKLVRVAACSPWAIEGTDPMISGGLALNSSGRRSIALRMREGVPFHGAVRLPDGRSFAPRFESSGKPRSLLQVILKDVVGGYTQGSYVGSDGRFEFESVASGFHTLRYEGEGDGFDWGQSPIFMVPIGLGPEASHDIDLLPGARITVEQSPSPEDPAIAGREPKVVRYLVGLHPDQALPDASAYLLSEEEGAPIVLARDREGGWKSFFNQRAWTGVPAVSFPSGRYDFFLVERQDAPGAIAVRLLETKGGVDLRAGQDTVISLGKTTQGDCAIEGTIHITRPPALEDLMRQRAMAPILQRMVPHVHLFGSGGAYVGTGYAAMSDDELLSLFDAANHRDLAGLSKILGAKPWRFGIGNLPAGRYRLQAQASGYPDRFADVVLLPGRRERVEVEFESL